MSGGLDVLSLKEEDVTKMLVACSHLGTQNVNFQLESYVYKRRRHGGYIFNIHDTWEKLMLAARAIVAVENPADVYVISSRPAGQRAVLKFAAHTGATAIAGRFTPGAFTNQIQKAFREPRILIVTDPEFDHQPVTEGSYVNIPVIAFCNSDSPTRYVDIAIPCNNKSNHSVGLMWWLLAREVLRLRGTISREGKWDVVVDLFFYKDPDEAEKEELEATKEVKEPAPNPVLSTPMYEQQLQDLTLPTEPSVVPTESSIPASVPVPEKSVDDWTLPVTVAAPDWQENATDWASSAANWN